VVKTIAAWLIADPLLSDALNQFLKDNSPQRIWEELVEPFHWDTGSPNTPEVIYELHELIVGLAAERDAKLSSQMVINVENAMLRAVLDCSTRGRRPWLSRNHLVDVFNDAVNVSLAPKEFEALIARASSSEAELKRSKLMHPVPPMPGRYFRRSEVIDDLTEMAKPCAILVVHGSSGYGKSTSVASLLAGSDSSWVECRGVELGTLTQLLMDVVQAVKGLPDVTTIVLDDLDFATPVSSYRGALMQLWAVLKERNGRLVITANREMPSSVARALEPSAVGFYSVPAFAESEVAEYLETLGCSEVPAKVLARLTTLTFSGHPQLVDARVAAIEAGGFALPSPSDEDFFGSMSVEDERQQARRLVAQTLSSDSSELLYRLSLALRPLTRANIFSIAEGYGFINGPAELRHPGNLIDTLAGPWLERTGADRFRVSALVERIGNDVQGREWQRAVHFMNAVALIRSKSIDQFDASAVLMHSLAAENYALVGRLFENLLQLDETFWPDVASAFEWFSLDPLLERISASEFGRGNRISARMVQYRIAIGLGEASTASRIIELFDTEEAWDAEDTALARFAFYTGVIRESLSPYAFDKIAHFYSMWAYAGERLPQKVALELDGLGVNGPSGNADLVTIAGMVASAKVTGSAALIELNRFLEISDPETVRRFMWWAEAPDACAEWARALFESELARQEPDWHIMFDAFRAFAILVEKAGLLKCFSTVVPIAARIRAQELSDVPGALALVEQILETSSAPSIIAVKAELLQRIGKHSEAYQLLVAALPHWELLDNDVSPAFAYRIAAISAAALGKVRESATLLGQGALIVGRAISIDKSRRGLFARISIDAARCSLEARDVSSAMSYCESSINALIEADDDTLARSLTRTMYVILFILKVRFGFGKIHDLAVAWASTPNAMVSELADVNASRELLRFVEAKLEVALLGTDSRLARLWATVDELQSLTVRSLVGFVWLRRIFATKPEAFAGTVMVVLRTLGQEALGGADVVEAQAGYVRTAWLMLLASGAANERHLERWRLDVSSGRTGKLLGAFFIAARRALDGDIGHLDSQSPSSWDQQCIAAAMLDGREENDPRRVLHSHWILVRVLSNIPDVNFGVAIVLRKVEADWQSMARSLDEGAQISLEKAMGEKLSPWDRLLTILGSIGSSLKWTVPGDYIATAEQLKAASPVLL
jgi:hypothetical protein